jgi:hypothetical protein
VTIEVLQKSTVPALEMRVKNEGGRGVDELCNHRKRFDREIPASEEGSGTDIPVCEPAVRPPGRNAGVTIEKICGVLGCALWSGSRFGKLKVPSLSRDDPAAVCPWARARGRGRPRSSL